MEVEIKKVVWECDMDKSLVLEVSIWVFLNLVGVWLKAMFVGL